ncbi:hypothetical protein BTN50_2107 [Candidatus Enterovibrio altilux]|uniref:Mobile element protein n=1 Tax=Candidatus Enterovibrio altilux TaxID=1927128 RepID=A0A291BC35_9GAMM|nr:hypothetical protein BTN50_2107 [Candidatus Enterovibrio luxaltus]
MLFACIRPHHELLTPKNQALINRGCLAILDKYKSHAAMESN